MLACLTTKDQALIQDDTLRPSHVVYTELQQAQRALRAERKANVNGNDAAAPPPPGRPARPGAMADGMAGAMPDAMSDATSGTILGAPSDAKPDAKPDAMSETMSETKFGAAADTMRSGAINENETRPMKGNRRNGGKAELNDAQRIRRGTFNAEVMARITKARTTPTPFLERLVMFWSNHFSVSARKVPVMALAGAFEREAIRPHVLGRFADMLLAVEQHPAMLVYLDNVGSTGPNSRAGRNRGRGLNENLAREILELHTLGVDGGYTQDDVTNLARLITGWTVGNVNQPDAVSGHFYFARNRHEPGTWTIAGKTYRSGNENAGRQCLLDLARHPATARHITRKFARHFVGDNAAASLLERLEATFRETDGDLAALTNALVMSDDAWQTPPRKILPPYDFLVAISRVFDIDLPPRQIFRLSAALGQPLWRPPSPKGWPDDDDAWMAPAALRERLRFAERTSVAIARKDIDPREIAGRVLGERMSEPTRMAIARAETRAQGFEMLIMSPEFQRR